MTEEQNTGVSQEQLQAIIDKQSEQEKEIQKLRKENSEIKGLTNENGARKLKEVSDRYAELRILDDKVVTGFKNRGSERRPRYIYSKPDPLDPKTSVNFVDVILEDGEVITIQHKEFLDDSERVRAKIINVKEKPWVINQGSTRRKEIDGYSLVELDFVIDLEVKGITRTYTLRLPEGDFKGREVEVYEDYINM